MDVSDEQEGGVLVCTALVSETDKGIEAATTILKRYGREIK